MTTPLPEGTTAAPSELDLVARLRAGDPAAFELIVVRYADPLYAIARRLLRNEHDAAEVVQETFLHAFESIGRFRGESLLFTWLKRICLNSALMRLRRRRCRRERSIETLLPQFTGGGERIEPRSAWSEPVDDLLVRSDICDAVRRRIDELPEEYRTVLLLRDVDGLDTARTARLVGATPGAVKVRLHRARMALRELMERELVGDVR